MSFMEHELLCHKVIGCQKYVLGEASKIEESMGFSQGRKF